MFIPVKKFVLYVLLVLLSQHALGQLQADAQAKTNRMAHRVIQYLNRKQPDSIYAMAGTMFRQQISPGNWNTLAEKQLYPLLPFKEPVLISSENNVSTYKLGEAASYQLLVGLDSADKLQTLLLQPYAEENNKPMSPAESRTDRVARLALMYLNASQADSLYALAGSAFKEKISLPAWRNIIEKQIQPLVPLSNAVFISSSKGVNKYKTGSLQFLISLDKAGKFETFLIQAYHDDARKATAVATDNKRITALDSLVDKILLPYASSLHHAGLSAGVYYNGTEHFYNYGETVIGNRQLPTQNTLYEIGSITKTFTASLLARAVIDKKVALHDPILKYLPDSVADNKALDGITLMELAAHTSGLPRLPANIAETITDPLQPYVNYDLPHLFSYLKNFRAVRKPGTAYEYSNLAAGLLGVILEKVYHKPYEQLLHDLITTPLHLNSTYITIPGADKGRFAKGYDDKGEPATAWEFKALAGAGAIRSSAADLLLYGKQQLPANKNALTPSFTLAHQPIFNDGINKVALGWHYLPGNDRVIQHGGGTGGYRTMICADVKLNLVIVLLTNNATTGDSLGIELMQALEKLASGEH